MVALPSAMYSFDGFTHSAVLQSEAKSKNTYKVSLTFAMIFIIGIYLLAS
jgi:amino acid transporter